MSYWRLQAKQKLKRHLELEQRKRQVRRVLGEFNAESFRRELHLKLVRAGL